MIGRVYCASIVYPIDAEDFDFAYFRDRHAPMFAELLGENCVRFEVHRPLASPGAPPPTFAGAAYFWVTSPDEFGVTLAEHGAALYADIGIMPVTRAGPAHDASPFVRPVRSWLKSSARRV